MEMTSEDEKSSEVMEGSAPATITLMHLPSGFVPAAKGQDAQFLSQFIFLWVLL